MIEILLIIFFIILIISYFLLIGIKNKKQAVQTYTIPFFIKSYSNLIDKDQHEQNKSIIEKINEFFDVCNNSDYNGDGNNDISDDLDGE